MKRLVLLGGGHSQLAVLAGLARDPVAGTEVVLVSPARHAVYSGMVPGWIAGEYRFEDCRIDLQPLAQAAGVRRIEARAVALDPDERRLHLDDGSTLDYDLLSIDVGSTAATEGIAGSEHAIALRPIEALPGKLDAFDAGIRKGRIRQIAVAGAGAAGVEVLFTLLHRAATKFGTVLDSVLVADTGGLLPGHGERAQRLAGRELDLRGVVMRFDLALREVGPEGLVLSNLRRPAGLPVRIAADAVILATGAAPHAWLSASALVRDDRGFVAVDARLRSVSHPEVFASGDCATLLANPRPKSGVYAVRQGPVLAANLMAALNGGELSDFSCPDRALAILNLGDGRAIASWRRFAVLGSWVWLWKDRLDRGFIERYRRAG